MIVRPWLKYFIGVKFENREAFEDVSQFIVVANHNSHFDTVSIMAALPGNHIVNTYAVAASDYFGKTGFRRAVMKLFFNTILIKRKREKGEPSTIDILDGYLKKGHSLILFPEGTRGKPGVIEDFKKGIAVLLLKNPDLPFVPVYLDGFGRVLPKDRSLIIPLVCKVRFGSPIKVVSNDIGSILEMVKEAIMELRNKDERDRNQFLYE